MPSPGTVNRAIFSDPDIYQVEQERIFARAWQFLGHVAMIPEPGDYISTFTGQDPVILARAADGSIGAFLNSCPHRGNRVCLFDRGNTATFTCSYHGWSFATDGRLTGVPFVQEAYYGDLDKTSLGLARMPRLEVVAGLIFGSWDADAPTLNDYLGDMAWYLEHFLGAQDYGGLVPYGDRYSYTLRANWKILAENNTGDHYHTLTTHGSLYRIGLRSQATGFEGAQGINGPFEVALSPGHGIGGIETGTALYEHELVEAKALGPAAEEWVRERYARFERRAEGLEAKPYSYSHGNVFPNFSFFGRGGALAGRLFAVEHPRGPINTDVWQWFMVERDAPETVKEYAWSKLGGEGLAASGMFAQDDSENFERVTESSRSTVARRLPFYLGMGLSIEGNWPESDTWDIKGLPGVIGPRFSEHCQRLFYRMWDTMMSDGSADGV